MSVPVVILCGGRGTRLRERTLEIPKALVPIGRMPILLHIMKYYAHFGFKDFVLCGGFKFKKLKRYFQSHKSLVPGWNIRCVNTGLNTNTAGRLLRIKKYIKTPYFFSTYGDGLASVNLKGLLRFHRSHGRDATMTCVKPRIQFGISLLGRGNVVKKYVEKPPSKNWVNGGFFVFNQQIFDYIKGDEILEQGPFARLTSAHQMVGYTFDGFWTCMDTYKDTLLLNELWSKGKAPWKRWS